MALVNSYHFSEWKFELHFLVTPRDDEERSRISQLVAGSPEAHDFLWNYKGVTLELTINKDDRETDPEFKYINGNVEPNRAFGHIAYFVEDVYAFCQKLEEQGVRFQKKPDEGRMKGLAFALTEPDNYWVEIIKAGSPPQPRNNLCQTMYRIKDPAKTIPFYRDILGMSLVNEKHFPDAKFSLYFFATLPEGTQPPADPKDDSAHAFVKSLHDPVLELTHNHGTENDPNFSYYINNEDRHVGYGHIGFLVDDLHAAQRYLDEKGVRFRKRIEDGKMHSLAFIFDPDGYSIEVIQRGLADMRPK